MSIHKADGFCDKCSCKPCMCAELAQARKHGADNCESCGVKLIERGGYCGTDLCGPCCTGDADTIDDT